MFTQVPQQPKLKSLENRIVPVRRAKKLGVWLVPMRDRTYFECQFKTGLMTDVVFVHNAPEMMCEPQFKSTGEAIGELFPGEGMSGHYRKDAVEITYDAKRRLFVTQKGRRPVHFAHCLELKEDGVALASGINYSYPR